jgi:hypothetical protein
MIDAAASPPRARTVRRIALAVFGTVFAYFLIYFMLFKPSLPSINSTGDRYLDHVKKGDWAYVSRMHADRGAGDLAVGKWKQLRADFGPIRSVRFEGERMVAFPMLTRGMMAYTLRTDRGDVLALLDLKARWGGWKIRTARATFQPPTPFQDTRPGSPHS